MPKRTLLSLALPVLLSAGCSPWPDAETRAAAPVAQGWPTLVPLAPVLAQAGATAATADPTAAEAARAADLRARADALLAAGADATDTGATDMGTTDMGAGG